MRLVAMIPARMGSQRLAKKNMLALKGIPLIRRAIRRCQAAGCFDAIVVNSENNEFREHAEAEGAQFHLRPAHLGDNNATSEQFVTEFLSHWECDRLYQVHSISPLASADHIKAFVDFTESSDFDTVLSCVEEQIECAMNGVPVNFSLDEKTNSQQLEPIQRIIWSLTAWRSQVFRDFAHDGRCATYSGTVGYFPLDRQAGVVIKTQDDFDMADALLTYLKDGRNYGGAV